jgi:lipopolysaccharide/colanic/teichoic acid biosynthesis glycosyltransferase
MSMAGQVPTATVCQINRSFVVWGTDSLPEVVLYPGPPRYLRFSKKLEMDVWYVDHWSIWLDISILFRTFSVYFGQTEFPMGRL